MSLRLRPDIEAANHCWVLGDYCRRLVIGFSRQCERAINSQAGSTWEEITRLMVFKVIKLWIRLLRSLSRHHGNVRKP